MDELHDHHIQDTGTPRASGAEVMEKFEKESRTRSFDAKLLVKIAYILCLFFTLYHLAYASGITALQMVNIKHHALHVGLVLVLGFAFYPVSKKASRTRIPWYDWILIALSAFMPVYVFIRYPAFISTGFRASMMDLVVGTVLILLVLEILYKVDKHYVSQSRQMFLYLEMQRGTRMGTVLSLLNEHHVRVYAFDRLGTDTEECLGYRLNVEIEDRDLHRSDLITMMSGIDGVLYVSEM